MKLKDGNIETNATVIFDNGGGITLQLGGTFGHWYQDAVQAACDYITYMQDGHTDGWDGHEPDSLDLDPGYDDIRNGGYRVYDTSDVDNALAKYRANELDTGWGNIEDFVAALDAAYSVLDGRKMDYYGSDNDAWYIAVDGREIRI